MAEGRVALVSTSEVGFKDEADQSPTDQGQIGRVYSIPSDRLLGL